MSPAGEASPMKAAADLIQTLDIAYAEMTSNAAEAAKDAEVARKNARAASEIARRYLHRSYPKEQSQFGGAPSTPSASPQRSHYSSREEAKSTTDALEKINGIASEFKKGPTYEESKYNSDLASIASGSTTQTGGGRKLRTYKSAASSERIAQSHADDVLGLSMELERSKQSFKSEQRMHEDAKAKLASYKSKNETLEAQNKKLLEDLEDEKRQSTQTISDLEQELANNRLGLQAAEEDAQLALDLAKESAEKRDEVEDLLEKALAEIEELKAERASNGEKNVETPKRSVRFADSAAPPLPPSISTSSTTTPSSSGPLITTPRSGSDTPRAMVAAGRQLLRRSLSSPGQEVVTLEMTPAKSAERRRRLYERLTKLEVDTVPSPPRSPARSNDKGMAPNDIQKKLVNECQNASKLLQESGQRLDLGGHWWRNNSKISAQELQLEIMARQYSQSVEFKIEKQQKEINELESLCGFLENKLVMGTNNSA